MCRKIRCDGKSWKVFGFLGQLNKACVGSAKVYNPQKHVDINV
jgi:hypothetical protein